MPNLKVLFIASVYPRFETDLEVPWLRASVSYLKNAGCDIAIIAPSYKGLKNHEIDGVKVHRFRYAPAKLEFLTHDEGAPSKIARNPFLQLLAIPYVIFGSLKTLSLCRKLKPEIIHVHWPFPHAFMAFFAKFFCRRTKVMLTFYSAELLLAKKKKWIRPILKTFIKRADSVIAISSFARDTVKNIYNRDIEILPYGTTFNSEVGNSKEPQQEGKFRVLFVGRHIERKGIDYLIKAAATLDSEKFQIRIVGGGDLTEKLKKQAEEDAPEQVIFLGKLSKEDLEKEYKNANCFVLPAIVDSKGDTEGLGVVLIEAVEYGVPIIASDVGGIPDVVIDKKTGLLVPEKNSQALANAIKELSQNKDLQKSLALGASEHVKRYFSWDVIVEKQLNSYAIVCNHSKNSSSLG
ncbi:MAG: glycosyltransferase family 4 protein [Fibromonadales bacterium]|nr:glycosyltransferase family 4 protein [Fibromonadales bacterium]